MGSFLLGAIVGAGAMWFYGDQVRARLGGSIDSAVDRALGVLDAIDDRLEALRERLDSMTTDRATDRNRERRDFPAATGSA
jgi:hypothetical protein